MKLLISASEPSGDRLAADLVRALRERFPDLEALGLAGQAMRAAGVEAVAEGERLAVMGLVEVLGVVPEALRIRDALVDRFDGVELVVVVDAPDFNIPLARKARERGLPVVFYVSPQVWAWRKSRAAEIAELASVVVCLLPFEPQFYPPGKAVFLGHPVAERIAHAGPLGKDLAILPGSRAGEVDRLLEDLVEAAGHTGLNTRLPRAPGVTLPELPGIEVVEDIASAAGPAKAALTASGTATLELACLGRPMVVCYRVNPVTYGLGKLLVTGVEHMALPNLILGRRAVPELLQHFGPADLVESLEGVASQLADLEEVRSRLRGAGATDRIADRIAEVLG